MTIKFLYCVSCNKEFIFTIAEQNYYKEKNFEEPKRCGNCRKQRKIRQNSQNNYANNETQNNTSNNYNHEKFYNVKCFACGIETRINYRPSFLKPAFCSGCDQGRYKRRRYGV